MTINNILLVDDNQDMRDVFGMLLEDMLSSLGYTVSIECASSGEEALEKVHLQPYSLVVMDTQMDGIVGYAACLQMKEKNRNQVRYRYVC